MLSKEAATNFAKTKLAPTIVKDTVPADGFGSTALVSQSKLLADAGNDVFTWNSFDLYGTNQDELVVWNSFLDGQLDVAAFTAALTQITDAVYNDAVGHESRSEVMDSTMARAPATATRRWKLPNLENTGFVLVFLGLPLAIYVIFVISPFVQAFYYSMTDWSGFSKSMNFVGLANYFALTAGPGLHQGRDSTASCWSWSCRRWSSSSR